MFRIKIAMLVGGAVLAFIGYQEWQMAQVAKETPQTISCADLSAKGPGDNAHILMTDYLICDNFVYQEKKNSKTWNTVWVPAVPLDGEYMQKIAAMLGPDGKLNGPIPPPQNVKVIVKSGRVSGLDQMGILNGKLNGLVTNKIASIGSDERKLLEQSYPGTDFSTCYILEHERKPAGSGQIFGFLGGGAALSLLGLLWMVSGARGGNKA